MCQGMDGKIRYERHPVPRVPVGSVLYAQRVTRWTGERTGVGLAAGMGDKDVRFKIAFHQSTVE
jgi:hypothetical protein